jgi:Uma2 family endonuclease
MIQPLTEPRPRLWSKTEYHQLAELGFFQGQKAELIEGEIVVSRPQNWPHASTLDRGADVLRNTLGSSFWVRSQLPLNLGQVSEPEADVSVVAGRREDYTDHPPTAVLIVEISDTTLSFDRGRKASLDARAGILDYWIVNLVDEQLEVFRDPQPDSSQPYGYRYATQLVWQRPDQIAPLAIPQVAIAVADLLG